MQRFLIPFLFILTTGIHLQAEDIPVKRVEPPFWWVGFKNPQLQILCYGDNLTGYDVSLKPYNGVTLKNIVRVSNPGYLFLDIEISGNARPGKLEFVFTAEGKRFTLDYRLHERNNPENHQYGIDASDLIYLIMPDRFANGDPSNDIIAGMRETSVNRDSMYSRHGGDLQGIIDHLDYLESLGVTALWLNPVFENDMPVTSYHGYAATDLYRVDPRLGSNEKYLELIRLCHQRNMKVIMDIIHNHAGSEHWFIKDLPDSNWIHLHPRYLKTNYRATTLMDPYAADTDRYIMTNGWFDSHMPDLNQQHPLLGRYLIQNNIWWIEYARIDGFRLDTYAYSDQRFTSQWAKAILTEYPGFGIFGETWVHGIPIQAWFTGNNRFDKPVNSYLPGVTDFQLYYAINHALTNPFGWTDGVSRIYYTLAQDFVYANPFNNVIFLDNHDLSRFYSVIGEDIRKFKIGITLLMTLRGIPMLYYGTEILMKNFANPDGLVRQDFPGGWREDKINKFNANGRTPLEQEAWTFVSHLANWRKQEPLVHSGKLMQFVPENGVYVFFRYNDSRAIMVVINQNEEPVEINTGRFREILKEYRWGKDIYTGDSINVEKNMFIDPVSALLLELFP